METKVNSRTGFGLIPAKFGWQQFKTGAGVTSPAIGEIAFAKRSPIVMTRSATDRVAGGKMLDRRRSANLSGLYRRRFDFVALGAVDALPGRVVGMAKNGLDNIARGGRASIWRKRMADVTRANRALRRVACVTV